MQKMVVGFMFDESMKTIIGGLLLMYDESDNDDCNVIDIELIEVE